MTRPAPEAAGGAEAQRLDKWLVVARFARTRTVAARLIEAGHVRLNGARVLARDRAVKAGDVLTLSLPRTTLVVRVLAAAERRGPFSEARLLYEEVAAPPEG